MFKKVILRIVLTAVFPFVVVWVVVARILGELKTIPSYCWNDMRGEWASLVKQWRGIF